MNLCGRDFHFRRSRSTQGGKIGNILAKLRRCAQQIGRIRRREPDPLDQGAITWVRT